MKERMKRFWKDDEALGTLEILLIVAVLVAIAVAFRKWIMEFVNNLFTDVNETELQDPGDEIDTGDVPDPDGN